MATKEELLRAKIPCPETGIEIRRSLCDICSPTSHCGVKCYVKDGVILKVEGDENHPLNRGLLCTKGASNRQYVYREDRIKTPLKRVGPRGSGHYEPISWDEALDTIADKLRQYKGTYGAQSVFFFGGYTKWFRPILQRLAYAFGTPNYGTESSSCFTSGLMAWKVAAATPSRPDMKHSKLFLGWAHNPYYTAYLSARTTEALKKQGVKFLIVDTMYTQTAEKIADLFLQPKPGTDGALALAIANELIRNDWIDRPFIDQYVHGFEEYADYCRGFNETNVEALTGVPYEKVQAAAQMIHEYGHPMSIRESSAPLSHHINGMQNYRAIMALAIITGNYDVTGGQIPVEFTYTHQASGYHTREHEFVKEARRSNMPDPVGGHRFPLWNYLEQEAQAMDLSRQILEGTPYPIKALICFGINNRMFPDSNKMREALKTVEFYVDMDLFMTDCAKLADIVLPACTSLEREEFKSYPGGWAYYTKPVIPPLYESRTDADVMCELARRLNLDDDLLKAGYRACLEDILSPISLTVDQLQAADTPLHVPEVKGHVPYATLNRGLKTPTGKLELKSELIACHPEWGLDALPTYREPLDDADPAVYPMTLTSGGRLPFALHSRLHDMPWLRSLRPKACAELNPDDAAALGIAQDDVIEITTPMGSITALALLSHHIQKGLVSMYHGYREADISSLINADRLDPYSGFPAQRSNRCRVSKKG